LPSFCKTPIVRESNLPTISVFALTHFDYGPVPFYVPKMSSDVFRANQT
jgi:hypothetical protein